MRKQIDERFQIVFETLDRLLSVDEKPKKKIGFEIKEGRVACGIAKKGKSRRREGTEDQPLVTLSH